MAGAAEHRWVPEELNTSSKCHWRDDALQQLLSGRLLPPPPTLFLGESNDMMATEYLCTLCAAEVHPIFPQSNFNGSDASTFFKSGIHCNCSGWRVASYQHPGVSREGPFWLHLETAKGNNKYHRGAVHLDFELLVPEIVARLRAAWSGLRPSVVVAHSSSWDALRRCLMLRQARHKAVTMKGTAPNSMAVNRYKRTDFAQEWSANATKFVASLKRHFDVVLWRSPHDIWMNVTAPCDGGFRFHQSLLQATTATMHRLSVPLLVRWDRFVDQAETDLVPARWSAAPLHTLHPPCTLHVSYIKDLVLNMLLQLNLKPSE